MSTEQLAQALRYTERQLQRLHDWGGENQDRHHTSWRGQAGEAAERVRAALAQHEGALT